MSGYHIRMVDPDDCHDELHALQVACLPLDQPLRPAPEHDWWLLYDAAEIAVGFACLRPSLSWMDTGYLARAGVMAGHQGQGLQRRLIGVREQRARRYAWDWIVSDTSDNPASANNLARCGFKMYDPAFPWGGKITLYWRKRIKRKGLSNGHLQ